jgi:uncharacterized protein Veg
MLYQLSYTRSISRMKEEGGRMRASARDYLIIFHPSSFLLHPWLDIKDEGGRRKDESQRPQLPDHFSSFILPTSSLRPGAGGRIRTYVRR